MNKIPGDKEPALVGRWIMVDGQLTQDDVCVRINWLINDVFDQIKVDGVNWCALYRDPFSENYWELTYPDSDLHGGGPPSLICISEKTAREKYNLE